MLSLFWPSFVYFLTLLSFDMIMKYFNIKDKARWFFVHSFGNVIIIWECLYYIHKLIANPFNSIMHAEENHLSSIYIAIVHLYHVLFYKLNKSDIFHHLMFVFVGEVIHIFIHIGDVTGLYHFFICGLPGAIDYLILGLYELGYVTKKFRLCIASMLNIWLRLPGIVIGYTFVMLVLLCRWDGSDLLLLLIKLAASYFISVYNGTIYADQVIRADAKYNLLHDNNNNNTININDTNNTNNINENNNDSDNNNGNNNNNINK